MLISALLGLVQNLSLFITVVSLKHPSGETGGAQFHSLSESYKSYVQLLGVTHTWTMGSDSWRLNGKYWKSTKKKNYTAPS